MSSAPRLNATSHLVLGLLAREGPSTSYDLERHVAATLGHFWSFPHTLLYTEPARLAELGLVIEERESSGRRRRVFSLTAAGRAALVGWLDRPAVEPAELRDPGLLQLFFSDLASPRARSRLARAQLAIHRRKLDAYREDERLQTSSVRPGRGQRTVEHWRGETLAMGLLYEAAAVEFWRRVRDRSSDSAVSSDPAGTVDGGAGMPSDAAPA